MTMKGGARFDTWLDYRWLGYVFVMFATLGTALYAVFDLQGRRLAWRAVAGLLTLILACPGFEIWYVFFSFNTRLIPPPLGLLPWFAILINLVALTTTMRLSKRGWTAIGLMGVALLAAMVAAAWPAVAPRFRRLREQYPAARQLVSLHQDYRIHWDDFSVVHARFKTTNTGARILGDDEADLLYRFPRLKRLDLSYTHMTDQGMRQIDTLAELRELHLNHTHVGDATVERLRGLAQLWSLELKATAVTEKGIERLGGMGQLQHLTLDHLPVTQASLKHVSQLRGLVYLSLDWTPVGDEHLRHLVGMPSLRELHLNFTKTTDQGLDHLLGLPSLRALEVRNTRVTAEGLEQYKNRSGGRVLVYASPGKP